MTHRQLTVWDAWFFQRDNEESLVTEQLKRLIHEIRYSVRKPKRYKDSDYKVKFTRPEKATPHSVQQAAAAAKARWGSVLGRGKRKPKPDTPPPAHTVTTLDRLPTARLEDPPEPEDVYQE